MNTKLILFSKLAIGFFVLAPVLMFGASIAHAQADSASETATAAAVPMRWDIVKYTGFAPDTLASGGSASAKSVSGAQINLTGTGTFLSTGDSVEGVTGGGTWTITG